MRLLIVLLMTMSLGCVMMFQEQDIINRELAKCEGLCQGAGLEICGFEHNKLTRDATCACCDPEGDRKMRFEKSIRCI